MDFIKQLSPEQLKVLSPEQIRAFMGASSVLDTDMAFLKLFIRGVEDSNGYMALTFKESVSRFREILLKYPKCKFYILTKYQKHASSVHLHCQFPIDILSEDEMRARCPHIDGVVDMPLNSHIPAYTGDVERMIINGIANVYIVESQKLDMYDHLVKKNIIGRIDG